MMVFWLKRLHSLSGLVPLGVFLVLHFYTNSYVFVSPQAFEDHWRWMDSLPLAPILTWGFIYLPFLFHIGVGLWLLSRGENNVASYPYFYNWLYFLQRVTGIVLLLYLAIHIYETQWAPGMGEGPKFSVLQGRWQRPFWFWANGIGITAAAFHLSNGVRNALMTWGVTMGPRSQKLALGGAGFLFLTLLLWGWALLLSFAG